MVVRNIIKIDEEKCDGCGQCIVDCEEGALAIIDGKAKLIKESYCDGLGACIGNCPTGALTLEKREAPEFELPESLAASIAASKAAVSTPEPVHACPSMTARPLPAAFPPAGGCPGSQARQFQRPEAETTSSTAMDSPSALGHWPIQLHLVNFNAPHFQSAHILIAADCCAFACGSFHPRLLKGKAVAIACPKLDDSTGYMQKLTALFQNAQPKSVTVVRMEVPCCRGITQWLLSARKAVGSTLAVEEIILGVEGSIIARNVYAD
ncbi:MAG: 4Fe-4S binding protein [Candidatus Hydrogenedentales bacterium]